MIDVVFPTLRFLYESQLDDMFRIRGEAIRRWGWDVPGLKGSLDQDQFDTEDAIYLLQLCPGRERVLACCRLIPTTSPYMISEVFSHTCDLAEPPSSKDIWEASRLVIASDRLQSEQEYLEVLWSMGLALTELCVYTGIEKLAWYANQPLYQIVNSICQVEPLGRPYKDIQDNETYIPALSLMNEEALETARSYVNQGGKPISFAMAPISTLLVPDTSVSQMEAW